MNKKKINLVLKVLAVFFCIYIFLTAWLNIGIVKKQWNRFRFGEINVSTFIKKVSSNFMTDFEGKYVYINLNGLFVRLMGQDKNNDVIRLKNGMLSEKIPEINMEDRAENLIELNEYCKRENIQFLYVQAPDKMDLEKTLLPEGMVNHANENADCLLECLSHANIETLDLRPYTSATKDMVQQYFYKTDHHWNPFGAFIGFQKIIEKVSEIFPETTFDPIPLDLEHWNVHKKEKWFLGSHGRRVGIYFGGVEDLIWMTPAFDTQISCSIPDRNKVYKGDFEKANIRKRILEQNHKNYFNRRPYQIFTGRDYPLIKERNEQAASNIKVLLIKDSFSRPVMAYMSTEFQKLDVIDLRHYKESTLVEYIEKSHPDLVMMMLYPGSFSNDAQFQYNSSAITYTRGKSCLQE